MAEFTLRTVYRNFAYRGAIDEDPRELTARFRPVNFVLTCELEDDADPGVLIANTVVSDTTYGFTRVTVLEI
jgi:hypothetical protein